MMTTVYRPNEDAMHKALGLYRTAMRDYIEESEGLRSIPNWRRKVGVSSPLEISDFPRVAKEHWEETFGRTLGGNKEVWYSRIRLIVEARNAWAHPLAEDMELAQAITYTTLISDVLGHIGKQIERRDVEEIRAGLLKPSNSPQPNPLAMMIGRLANGELEGTSVIPWASPVPSFGDPNSSVATLGLNPSPMEFVDALWNPLSQDSVRLHTLESLGLTSWSQANELHIQRILDACRFYFDNNPYDRWFKPLDEVIRGVGVTYYGPRPGACHFDLVPFATEKTWTQLTFQQRSQLIRVSRDTLGLLLRNSRARVLILNGSDVVEEFQSIIGDTLKEETIPVADEDIRGYVGRVSTISRIELERDIIVLGFSAYIQTPEISKPVRNQIKQWIQRTYQRMRSQT